jgi:ethanolamine transporter EutH
MSNIINLDDYTGLLNGLKDKIVSPEFILVVGLTWLFSWAAFETMETKDKRLKTRHKRLTALVVGGILGFLVIDGGSAVLSVLYGVIAGGIAAGAVAELRARRGGTPVA